MVAGIVLYVLNAKDDDRDKYECPAWWVRGTFGTISFVVSAALFITVACFIPQVCTAAKYDAQIAVIEKYNDKLESEIVIAVDKYLDHEDDIWTNFYPNASQAQIAIGLYLTLPELKADGLVTQLIDTYKANIDEIKSLELSKTELTTKKFLVYFGH